mgnify:CR=1 FL=1
MNKHLSEQGRRDLLLINKALKSGDPASYNELMGLYRDPLYFMFYEKVNEEELAKDLTIESLGKAFTKLNLYNSKYAFSTWLFALAHNHFIDYLRKNKLSTISIEENIFIENNKLKQFNLASQDASPEQIMEKRQRILILRKIVTQLKPIYRDLVRLRYFKELSYNEISNKLGIPIGTVKVQLFRSREQLFKILSGGKDDI